MILSEAIIIAKTMKRPIVYITKGYMFGLTEDCSTLSSIILSDEISDLQRPICYYTSQIINCDSAKLSKISNATPSLFFGYYKQIAPDVYIDTMSETDLFVRVQPVISRCMEYKNTSKLILECTNLTKIDELFNKAVSVKTKDGLVIYSKCSADNLVLFMSTFVSMHPVTKSDTVNLQCYGIDRYSFLAQFEIVKKKSLTIQEYIRYRYL